MRPYSRAIVGIVFSVSTSLVAMWVMSRFPGMDIPTPYWIFGFFAPLFISTPVCLLLARQVEQKRRLAESLQKAMAELRHLSEIDQMTGLFNRATFLLRLEQARAAAPGVCLLIDVDHFKQYNDHYGHLAGDACLKRVASVFKSNLKRSSDLVARYGGEEFAVLLLDVSIDQATQVADRLRGALMDDAIEHQASPVNEFVTASIGVAQIDYGSQKTISDLIKWADDALYVAKGSGRNRIQATPL